MVQQLVALVQDVPVWQGGQALHGGAHSLLSILAPLLVPLEVEGQAVLRSHQEDAASLCVRDRGGSISGWLTAQSA